MFCQVPEPRQLFDACAVLESASARSVSGAARLPYQVHNTALFAAEKANHVLEEAHLMELSAGGQHSSQPHSRSHPLTSDSIERHSTQR